MTDKTRIAALAVLVSVAVPVEVSGQQVEEGATGRLIGAVTDADSDEPLEGVSIRIPGTRLRTLTDENGRFEIDSVPPGTYRVQAELGGYAMITFKNVELEAGTARELSVRLPASARVYAERQRMTALVPPQVANWTQASRILSAQYPLVAKEWGIGADVVVRVQVSAEGKVVDARIHQSSGYREFDEAALKAVRKFSWTPGRNAADEAIDAWTLLPIRFEGR